ncbi:MAG: acyl-CoA dehydrogenase family protein [Ilumatobacteraceae bacterium]
MREHAVSVDADANFPKASIEALGAAGLLGLTLSADVGGLGATPDQYATAVAAVAEGCGSTAMVYLMHLSAANVLTAATPTGHPDVLGELASGNKLGTLAFSEKGSRSHFWAPVSGLDEADGGLRLVAEKSWVTAANRADVVVASVRSVDAAGPMDCELYLVGGDDDGYVVTGGSTDSACVATTPPRWTCRSPSTSAIGSGMPPVGSV